MNPPITRIFPALKFERPWQLIPSTPSSDPAACHLRDNELMQLVGRGEIGPCLHLSFAPQSMAVTRREARMTNFPQAAQRLAAAGWPLVVRSSGGSCVPQGPGVLNLSLIHSRLTGWSLEDGYRLLCELLTRLIASYGLQAETGEVPGSFCDGRYNLQIAGRKLVGTAQRWAGSTRAQAAILAHACLLIDLDLDVATAQINQLYALCDNPQRFDPAACTNLRQELPELSAQPCADFICEVEERLAQQLREQFALPTPRR